MKQRRPETRSRFLLLLSDTLLNTMNPHVETLQSTLEELRRQPESSRPQLQAKASIQSAIALADTLSGLTVVVNDMASSAIERLNELSKAIETATAQAKQSSDESSKLSKKLNTLTVWIAVAALASAAGTITQALVALGSHPK
jgi:hypothetical protein